MTAIPPRSGPAGAAGPAPEPATSAAAVASLVCGVFAFCTCGVTAIPAIILGAVALNRIRHGGGTLRGRGLAIAGIILAIVMIFAAMVFVGMTLLVSQPPRGSIETTIAFRRRDRPETREDLSPEQAAARSMISMTRLVQAAEDYARDHQGRLPTPEDYPGALLDYIDPDERPEGPAGRDFAMNAAVCGLRREAIRRPDRTVLFFECPPHGPFVGGRELLRPLGGNGDAYVVAFADGHIEWVPADQIDDLLWQPGSVTTTLRL
ncbi:MAG: DUF4190 domain-containing protein [Planctomycetes bacterium]|nr:DUF4190 domain-containing protein [Planctomycetota bacterium]